jgi:hypothetical protein
VLVITEYVGGVFAVGNSPVRVLRIRGDRVVLGVMGPERVLRSRQVDHLMSQLGKDGPPWLEQDLERALAPSSSAES